MGLFLACAVLITRPPRMRKNSCKILHNMAITQPQGLSETRRWANILPTWHQATANSPQWPKINAPSGMQRYQVSWTLMTEVALQCPLWRPKDAFNNSPQKCNWATWLTNTDFRQVLFQVFTAFSSHRKWLKGRVGSKSQNFGPPGFLPISKPQL